VKKTTSHVLKPKDGEEKGFVEGQRAATLGKMRGKRKKSDGSPVRDPVVTRVRRGL